MKFDVAARIFEPFFTTKGERGTAARSGPGVRRHRATQGSDQRPLVPRTRNDVATGPASGGAADSRQSGGERRGEAVRRPADSVCGRRASPGSHGAPWRSAPMATAPRWHSQAKRRSRSSWPSRSISWSRTWAWALASTAGSWRPRSAQQWPHIRIVLATGWGADIAPDEAREKGIEAVVSKPVPARRPAPSSIQELDIR